jgi:hypothetical protein
MTERQNSVELVIVFIFCGFLEGMKSLKHLSFSNNCTNNRKVYLPSLHNRSVFPSRVNTLGSFTRKFTQESLQKEHPLFITDKCAEMINKITKEDWIKNKDQAKLRITVKGGGCSGYEYAFSLDDKPVEQDDMYSLGYLYRTYPFDQTSSKRQCKIGC